MNSSTPTQKVWNFCHTPLHDGVDDGDCLELRTYPLFLRMADVLQQEIIEHLEAALAAFRDVAADLPAFGAAAATAAPADPA